MLRAYGLEFVELTAIIEKLWNLVDEAERAGEYTDAHGEGDYYFIQQELIDARRVVERLPFPSVAAQIERLLGVSFKEDSPPSPRSAVIVAWPWIKELQNRLWDDAAAIQFVHIQPEFVRFYTKDQLFGAETDEAFPSAIDDVADAGKCLALGQGTASVFHLMRVMEVGLKALANSLGIPYAPSWESYLKQINDRIGAQHKTKTRKWKKDEPFYRDVAGDLHTVKIAWRNPTMHIVKKYTPDEADGIFRSVRSFMQRLATRLME
jgi:hypothetical protein